MNTGETYTVVYEDRRGRVDHGTYDERELAEDRLCALQAADQGFAIRYRILPLASELTA